MDQKSESNGCIAPLGIGLFVFLITLIKEDFGKALGAGLFAVIVWFFIILFFFRE